MAGPTVTNLNGVSPALAAPSRILAALRRVARGLRAGAAVRRELVVPESRAWSARVGQGGATFRCLAGAIWLTREGDAEDRILEAGAAFRTDRAGRVALLALRSARVSIAGDFAPPGEERISRVGPR